MRRAELIDGLERNWREEKRLIDEKSINNQRTEAKQSTRRAETIDGLKCNGRLVEQKQSTDCSRTGDYKSRNNFVDGLARNWPEEK